ncbi:protein unc-80 homolog isoform X2 [Trichogramma pretiosum]|uniref:protein unc-80 homolog isoform X2 n=1 Tax=Trichogramma pretiosum TaxID=7493 RepID=UPI000C71A37D|nr:protein unc-80 homolog isoform X2 [Trichogramma pretiosum]
MELPRSMDNYEIQLPVPLQLYLWKQLRPFIRVKLGRVHEASCVFCQRAPGHHEMKEACTSLERVLVQNIHNELTPPLRQLLGTVPRWRFIQASFPFIVHAAANILHNKKDFQNLGPLETTLLYILHWIILDAAEECADQDGDLNNPFYYLFSIPTMTLFVYLFVPLCGHLKDIDFKSNLRLENGQKIWYPIYECRHPEAPCFTAHCRPKPRPLWRTMTRTARSHHVSDDVFLGSNGSPPSQSASAVFSDQGTAATRNLDDESGWVSSPKEKAFPETIPEESSSTEDEHVVIFTLPSLGESERMMHGVKEVSTIYAGEASIFHVAMARRSSSSKPTLTIEQVTPFSEAEAAKASEERLSRKKERSERESGSDSKSKGEDQRYTSSSDGPRISSIDHDVRAATFFDVAVIRCLFLSQWQEEGIFWALQFLYNRLRRINEESSVQQMPRRRSNSLPIPKIEVSIYQSPESKKKDDEVRDGYSQDTHDSTTADVNYYGDDYKAHESDRSHMRRASEKTKRRMKMADLKAFVETKLLSKSEKALEKIGQEEPKMTSEDSHRSLDTGEEQLSRQPSISSRIFDAKEGDFLEHSSNLLKGKSMPSLRYIGEPKVERKQSRFYSNSCAAPNPIITVTEHTPVPSPDYMKRQGSMDSQLDAINSHGTGGRRTIWERKPSLTRSQTDSNITYSGDEPLEAPGSSCFITKDGDIDIEVVLKAIHNVTFKDNQSCSLRVCESILNLIELLMDMGVLTRYTREESVNDKDSCGKSESGKRQQQQQSQHQQQQQHQRGSPSDSEAQQQRDESSPHVVALNTVVRILRHLGCPHGCNEGTRGPQADFCRSQIQTILGKLHEADRKQFSTFLRGLCKKSPLAYVIDLFHAYLGFCVDPGSLLSPLNQKRGSSKSPDSVPQGSYATNFGAGMMGGIANANNMTSCNSAQNAAAAAGGGGGIASASSSGGSGYNTGMGPGGGIGNRFRSIESQIMGYVFKTIVTKCCEGSKSLRSQDNIALYCDVRQLMTYIKEAHGGVFRRVALSCILDSADRPNRVRSEPHQTKVIRHINLYDLDPSADVDADGIYTVDDKTGARRYLFKKRSASSAGAAVSARAAAAASTTTAELQSKLPFHSIFQSLLETELSDDNVKVSNQSPVDGVAGAGGGGGGGGVDSCGGGGNGGGGSGSGVGNVRKKHHALTPRQSERNLDLNEPSFGIRKSRKTNRLKIGGIVNWFSREYRRRGDHSDSHENSESPTDYNFLRQPNLRRPYRRGVTRTSKGVSQTFKKAKRRMEDKLSKMGLVKGKKKKSFEEVQGNYYSRKDSLDIEDATRETEFVVIKERRLVPKQAILDGMLRFSFLLDTCHPGTVPDHHLMAALLDLPGAPVVCRAAILLECASYVHQCNKGHWPIWMKSNFPMFRPSMALNNRGAPTGIRRTHVLQRAGGKLFYQWAEAVGSRLEQFLAEDRACADKIQEFVENDKNQAFLLAQEEEEDFLDEASIVSYGSKVPMALRLVACCLLMEITSFLRETYPSIPKSSRLSIKERAPPWEKLYSREANRRWSMALSSMGHSQTSAQSLQSIAGADGKETERKISFVLHEPDNESEGSSKSNVTIPGEELGQSNERERAARRMTQQAPGRPFLLRRGTSGNTATGSFKRRSLKLRRNTKEGKEIEVDAYTIQSKRKVSSLSDRSDTSEPGGLLYGVGGGGGGGGGEVSGEESPGILSDDQQPESPSDSNDTDDCTTKNFPWMRIVAQMTAHYHFLCDHQSFCHPFCHRRQMRAGEKLIKAVRKIYGEEFGYVGGMDMFGDPDAPEKKAAEEERGKKDKRCRKVSDQQSVQVSPVKRKDSMGRKLNKIDKSLDGSQSVIRESMKDLADHESNYARDFAKAMEPPEEDYKEKELSPVQKYMQIHVRNAFHAPIATLLKGAAIVTEDLFVSILPVAWELLLENNQEVAAAAASLFIVASVRAPSHATDIMHGGLKHANPEVRISSILRFQVLWRHRYQVWQRMEEQAHATFKVPPPGIEFTLPSPKIGIESLPVVDPPWMPQVRTKVEEVTINQERHRALVTATKTRKKQQTELIKRALQAQDDKKKEERINFLITTIPITFQAAYEPSPVGDDHDDATDEDIGDMVPRNLTHHVQSAQALFPSTLGSSFILIIDLLDDPSVTDDGMGVYLVAYQLIWNCLVEDSALFLRYIMERLTRDNQDNLFKILRHLIRFIPKLPQQAAFALYNYIIGYIMFYVRSPHEEGQKHIGTALSILWMVVHSVHGIMFKDLKQILRKEQCDASILLTANVPSAKKIVVHGPQNPDDGGIPSQFPVQEDTQFCQILRESLDFFGIEESKHKEYFLVDHKTHQIHNPASYVRDYYFFKRSQYPQLELVHMEPEEAFNALQREELTHKFVEIGKVLLTWAILKNVDMVVQRVVFLHEELMKLPSFPRKALECDLDLYKGGEYGQQLLAFDVMHKFMWVRLIARMFEAMAGNFAYSGDIHLFINVLNGTLFLHSTDSCILRYVVATYINAAFNFKNIFSTNGYFLIIPTLMQLYSTHQTNKLVTTTVEYAVKQFYMMHRKPFIMQMFGSVSAILDTDETSAIGEAHKVPSSCLFNLLLSLETPSPDPLNIGELVKEEKPLKAIDFCYHDESEMVTILDCISMCVMVVSYAADSLRGQQMLIILEAIMPCYVQQIQLPSYNKEGKTEKEIINQLAITVRTLVNNSESLAKYYNRPQKNSPEHKGSSQRNYGKSPYSPGFEFDEEANIGVPVRPPTAAEAAKNKQQVFDDDAESSHKNEFVRPRDTLLNMVGDFVARCSARLVELDKKSQDGKTIEILDSKCHIRLADVAHSLLKISPYDPQAMACRGLKRYMNDILPFAQWSNDDMRPALTIILRRLDKTFSKIYKKASIRRSTNWDAASELLKGLYETLLRCPYIAHFQNLKTLLNTCQSLIIGDTQGIEITSSATVALMSRIPPPFFCSTVLRLIALQVISLGEGYTLENVCGSHAMFATAARAENVLLNLLIPLFLRVGAGRQDVPQLRKTDICFALNAVLNTLWPTGVKSTTTTATNLKPTADIRTGSLTFAARDSKSLTKTSLSLYQVAFLALKIIIISFENDLTSEWPRILRTMKLLNKRNEASLHLWNFLEFVVTHRTPLYIQMMLFIIHKIGQAPISEHERTMQGIIRDRMNGIGMSCTKSKSDLLNDLINEWKKLKEEIEDRKFDELQPKRSVVDMHQVNEGQPRTQRPSLLIDLLTGDLGSRSGGGGHGSRATPADTPGSNSTTTGGGPGGHTATTSSQPSVSSTSNMTKISIQSQVSIVEDNPSARGSISSTSAGSGTLRDGPDGSSGALACPGSSPIQATDKSYTSITTSDERNRYKPRPVLTRQKTSKLRFIPSIELRHSSGETITSQLSPNSPMDDSSGESKPDKPRLQRSMGASKRTFRLRKSRRAHAESAQSSSSRGTTEGPESSLSPDDQPTVHQASPQLLSPSPPATIEESSSTPPYNAPSDSSSVPSRRDSTTILQLHHQQLIQPQHHQIDIDIDQPSTSGNGSHAEPSPQLSHRDPLPQGHPSLLHHAYLQLRPQSDISWDEDTSSTSGYRESYSLQLVSLESSNGNNHPNGGGSSSNNNAPPLASPDLPSSSSTTTNYMAFDGSSPENSINSNGGERQALLTQSSQRTNSQHSLLMGTAGTGTGTGTAGNGSTTTTTTQDEDTLI